MSKNQVLNKVNDSKDDRYTYKPADINIRITEENTSVEENTTLYPKTVYTRLDNVSTMRISEKQ